MFHYNAFGLEISSEIELPGMIKGSLKPDVIIKIGSVNLPSSADVDEGPNYLVEGDNVYLWWDDIGQVQISDGKTVVVSPIANLDGSDGVNIIPFLLGPIMAILLHQRGFLVLHGSSVRRNNSAIAFLGHRGNGKSTTAINLYKNGYPLVTDDILAVKFSEEGLPVVYPGYPHVRLGKDSYEHVKDDTGILTPLKTIVGKIFCDASYGFSTKPVILEKIYVIEKADEMGISVLKSQENLIDLIRHSVANRIFQKSAQKENLRACAQLVNNVNIHRLEIAHSFNNIPELIRIIENDNK